MHDRYVILYTAGKAAAAESCSSFSRVGSDVYHQLSTAAKQQLTKVVDDSVQSTKQLTAAGVMKEVDRITHKLKDLVRLKSTC